jgi:nucleosome binding factor SPN SPT16 subunit
MSEQHQKDRIFAFQLPNLTKNFGFVMGIEFREGSLSITPSCHAIAAKGMVFNVNIGLSGLVNKVLVY